MGYDTRDRLFYPNVSISHTVRRRGYIKLIIQEFQVRHSFVRDETRLSYRYEFLQ